MRIRAYNFDADADTAYNVNADPDPTFQPDSDQDPQHCMMLMNFGFISQNQE
jgi:hypothetical protein